jgi:hypothetical protein
MAGFSGAVSVQTFAGRRCRLRPRSNGLLGSGIESIAQELKAQSSESDLVGGDISLNVEEHEEIPIQDEIQDVNSGPTRPVEPLETNDNVPSAVERPTRAPIPVPTLGDGPIGVATNWMKLNRWGGVSRKLNRYISWYCFDIAKRLTKGDKISEQTIIRAREIWEMAHKLGFDETQ